MHCQGPKTAYMLLSSARCADVVGAPLPLAIHANVWHRRFDRGAGGTSSRQEPMAEAPVVLRGLPVLDHNGPYSSSATFGLFAQGLE